ncbi:MAG: helix-turn-helix domain-containing protein [Deltaproteobacteria bacterium]|nr:helix-turn-helix domain-containing protein [Deltaproteobacteria bacterium]
MKFEIDSNALIDKIVSGVTEQINMLVKHGSKANVKDDELMNVEEIAEYLKVTKSWIYQKVHSRQIPFRKAGKFPRFKKNHIDLWMLNPYHPDLNHYNLNHNGRR